jgi:hypothetical protein
MVCSDGGGDYAFDSITERITSHMKKSEAGKGDSQRPTDHKKYAENYDKIFKKDPYWPFPTEHIPYDGKLPKFNPNNIEDALL